MAGLTIGEGGVMNMRAAFYEKEITPPLGSQIPGGFVKRVATGVLDRLYVKAAVFELDDTVLALVAADAVNLSADTHDAIVRRINQFIRIPGEQVTVCATHTHLGVPCGEPVGSVRDDAYMDWLHIAAADCVVLACQRLKACTLMFGEEELTWIAFNRNYVMRDGSIRTNPFDQIGQIERAYSGTDPSVPVLWTKAEDGTVLGAVTSFACHQDTIHGNEYSGDYSSAAAEFLKERFGNDFIFVYFPGTCGDINHIDPMGLPYAKAHYRSMGRALGGVVERVIVSGSCPVRDDNLSVKTEWLKLEPRQAAEEQIHDAECRLRDQELQNPELQDSYERMMDRLLIHYNDSRRESVEVPVQVAVIGGVYFIALPGEVYHRVGLDIRNGLKGNSCILATLANGNYGYIPTADMFSTDVYEIQLCGNSFLPEETAELITRTVLRLAVADRE